jgi:hypothetical protein
LEGREEDAADGAFVGSWRGRGEAVAREIGDEERDFGAEEGEDVSPPMQVAIIRVGDGDGNIGLGHGRTYMNSVASRGRR